MATKKTGTAKAAPKSQVEEIAVEQEIVATPKQKVEKPTKPGS